MLHPFPDAAALEGLMVRRLGPTDVDDLFAHFSDPVVTEFLDFAPLSRREEAEDIIAWATDLLNSRSGIRWAIRDAASERFVGTCGFNSIVTSHGSRGVIAYDLSPDVWGQGIMGKIIPFMQEVGFGELRLHRLEACVTPGNTRSAHVLERHGFRHEGRLRGYGHWCDAFWDQDMFAMVAPDWIDSRTGDRP